MKLIKYIPSVLLAGELYSNEMWALNVNFYRDAVFPIRQIIYYEIN